MLGKNLTKIIFSLFAILLILPLSSIDVDAKVYVTYNYKNDAGQPQDNVNILVYDCLDARCTNVKTPSFKNYGNSNDYPPSSDIQVTYPTRLETTDGYAVYHYKEGYLPMEFFVDWANGEESQTSQNTRAKDIVFIKKAGCSSHIENFRIINADQPNLPIQIFVKTKLDASTYSAFSSNPGTPEYVPMQYKDFYSAETKVTLKIYNENGNSVFTGIKNLNLFMDSSDEVMFEWTPTVSGKYKAVMSTDVTDEQCSSSISQSVSSEFSAVVTSLDKCYTLLNNLRTSVIEPFKGENIDIVANKISNYRNPTGDLFSLATDINLKVYDPNGNLVNSQAKLLPKNPDAIKPTDFSFKWVPNENGLYTIKVHGIAKDPICLGKENLDETETMNVLVKDQGRTDLNLRTIGNKQVNENNALKFTVNADYNGGKKITFSALNMPEGASFNPITREFSYKPTYDAISHSLLNNLLSSIGFDLSKDFFVTFKATDGVLTDQEIVRIKVIDVNRAPVLQFIPDITTDEGSLVKINPVATDADGDNLKFSFTSPLNRNGEWKTKVGDRGIYNPVVTVKDNFNGQDSQEVTITVIGQGPIPEPVVVISKEHKLRTTSLYAENDKVKAGDYLIVYTKIKNYGSFNENSVKVRITVPELGIIEQTTATNLDEDDQRLKIFMIYIPKNTKPGYYVLKSQVFNGNSEETEAIEFRVVL